MDGNGSKEEIVKHCPFLNDWCIKEKCALNAEMVKNMGGLQQKFGMCVFSAMLMLLSEINSKTPVSQQRIEIPKLFKG